MGDHDIASALVTHMGAGETRTPVTPGQLIEAFCSDRDHGYVGATASERVEEDGTRISRGFCGYNGRRDTKDSLLTGFDTGYDLMGYLEERGWRALSSKGDWPYVIYLRWAGTEEKPGGAIVEYCEADFTVWEFATATAAHALYATLRDA